MFKYFSTRCSHFKKCWEQSQRHTGVAVLSAMVSIYSAVTTFGPLVNVPALTKLESLPKLPLPWALVIVLCALLFTLVEGSYRLTERRKVTEVLPSDPQIYFSFIDRRGELMRRTPFEARNQGQGVARNILIHPVDLDRRRASFKEVDSLGVEVRCEIIPNISNMGALFKYDFINFIIHDINESSKEAGTEVVIPLFATYKDHTGKRCFKICFDFVFYRINHAVFGEHGKFREVKPNFEIRHKDPVLIDC
jgi:hypothetical protein